MKHTKRFKKPFRSTHSTLGTPQNPEAVKHAISNEEYQRLRSREREQRIATAPKSLTATARPPTNATAPKPTRSSSTPFKTLPANAASKSQRISSPSFPRRPPIPHRHRIQSPPPRSLSPCAQGTRNAAINAAR